MCVYTFSNGGNVWISKNNAAGPIGIMLCIIVLCFNILSCRQDSSLLSRLRKAVKQSTSPNTFNMADITDFQWDELYIFGPYTPGSEIENTLGFSWPPAFTCGIDKYDGHCLLVFVGNNEVTRYYMYPRNYGDFSQVDSDKIYTLDSAIFSVRVDNGWALIQNVATDVSAE